MKEFEPNYNFNSNGESISLASGLSCLFKVNQNEVKGIAEIRLDFYPKPQIQIIVQCEFEIVKQYLPMLGKVQFILINNHSIPVFPAFPLAPSACRV